MDEQRFETYFNLIQELLSCPNGEESAILSRSSELVDEGLVIMCQQVAEMSRGQGQENQAGFLINLAEQLAEYLNMTEDGGAEQESQSNYSVKDYLKFLQQLIQIEIQSNSDPKIVYPFLAQHQNKLDLKFAEIITQWFNSNIDPNNSKQNKDVASLLNNIAIDIQQFSLGSRLNNIEIAITCFQSALTVYTPDALPEDWAMTQNNLANAYSERIKGLKADNLESAIAYFQSALTVYTPDAFSEQWAVTQNNLAIAYSKRIKGSRADNLESAIACFENALTVRTKDAFSQQWADTQNNLAAAYRNRIKGSKADNLELAITYYQNALTVRTKDALPQYWAGTQNNLAIAYFDRIKGSKADNLEQAITCFENALTVRTKDALPQYWADTQNNLGTAYSNRIKGSKADNLERAITCFENALTVRTKDALPEDWAMTQNNLGTDYSNRIKGSRADNLEDAITCFTKALTVYTQDAFPEDWAITQNNLAIAYSERIKGSRADNLESVIACFQSALTVRTRYAFPQNNTATLNNLGLAYQQQSNFYNNDPTKKQTALDNAYNTFKEALDVVEYIRGDITDTEAKTKLNEKWDKLYRGMVQLCLELGKEQEAIEYVDRSKARNLVELIAIREAYPENNDIPGDVRQRLQELRNLIAEEDRRLQQDPQPDYQYINQLRQEYQEKFPYKPLAFNEMQNLLDEKTAILEWYILPGDKFLTFILTANGLKLQVFTKEDLDQLFDFGKEYLTDYYTNNDQWQDNLVARMQTLSNILHLPQLLESVFEELPQCEKLILMPYLFLHLLPIHALPVMHNGENKPLQEYFAQGVSYAPNCQLLQQDQKRQYSQFDRLFAIQNPTNDLTWADLEVESIKEMFHPNKHDSLEKQNATKTNFLDKDLSQVNHLYFSCHGSSNIEDPFKSGLQLNDAVLTLEEIISKLKLSQCSLVTLSACETGQVGLDETDEYISLASGFILAGASNIVSTLWAVPDDISGTILMIHFYETLLADRQKPVAVVLQNSQKWLREATTQKLLDWADQCTFISQERQEEIKKKLKFGVWKKKLNDKRFDSPYHWAAFCAIGQ